MPNDPSLYNTPAPPKTRSGVPIPNTGTAPEQKTVLSLPFGISNLPIFQVGFWYRVGVGAIGILFIWWAVLIFIASTKAGKAAVGVAETALIPEGKVASLATKAAKSKPVANAASAALTDNL